MSYVELVIGFILTLLVEYKVVLRQITESVLDDVRRDGAGLPRLKKGFRVLPPVFVAVLGFGISIYLAAFDLGDVNMASWTIIITLVSFFILVGVWACLRIRQLDRIEREEGIDDPYWEGYYRD